MLLRAAALACAIVLGCAAVTVLVRIADVRVVDPDARAQVVLVLTAVAGLAGAGVALLAGHRPAWAVRAGVVVSALLLWAGGSVALHGTRWGWSGLFADASFRTQMATRYADTPALVDYGYRGLPAYYPPALGWLQGRLAAVTDLAGWEAVKPVQLVVGALVPVAAYLLWRSVVGALPAVAVAGLTTVWTAHPQKPDEWLVLTCLLPWWLLAVRDVRAPGVRRWPAWGLGLVLGALLLVHTYWFLPFGLATLLALAHEAVRPRRSSTGRREPRLSWRRALTIGAVGLGVSVVWWVPVLAARLRLPWDDLQLRYAIVGGHVPWLPGPRDALGLVGLVGVGWLLWAAARRLRGRHAGDEVAGGLALALAGSLLTLALGEVAARFDVAFLAFKTNEAVVLVLLTAGVLGAAEALGRWRTALAGRRWASAVPVALVGLAAAAAGHHLAHEWVTGTSALVAQTTRYPDGSWPAPGETPYIPTLFVEPDDPSVSEIVAAWDELRPDLPLGEAVLVTTRVDLLATTPVHWFSATKSIYSHPNGRFADRVALLDQVAACPDSACAVDLLRGNDLDRVDGLVLRRVEGGLELPFMVDTFPERTERQQVVIPDEVLRGPGLARRELGEVVVVVMRP
jgi:galactan 5-O-arabinofuranosyltransferase